MCPKFYKNEQIQNYLESNLYKLDLDNSDTAKNPKATHKPHQRAQSSQSPNRKKSLVAKLKQNDKILQRGVTGSPLGMPSQSNMQLNNNAMTILSNSTCE